VSAGFRVTHPKREPKEFACSGCAIDSCDCLHQAMKYARELGNGAHVLRIEDGAIVSYVRRGAGVPDEMREPRDWNSAVHHPRRSNPPRRRRNVRSRTSA
jgi:hypothetical protein